MKRVLVLTFCIFATISSLNAQKSTTDRLVNVRHFLQLVYPEGGWDKRLLCLEDEDAARGLGADEWVLHEFSIVAVQGYCFPQEGRPPITSAEVLYRAGFGYSKYGQMIGFNSNPYEAQNRRMQAEIEAHQEWSKDDIKAALRAAGYKYGPDDKEELLKSVRLDELQKYIGPFELKTVTFNARYKYSDPDEDGKYYRSYGVIWVIEGTCRFVTGPRACRLQFDAYRGRLNCFSLD